MQGNEYLQMDTEQLNADFLRVDPSISVNIRIYPFFINRYGEQDKKNSGCRKITAV